MSDISIRKKRIKQSTSDSDLYIEVGARLRKFRRERDYTQEQMAELIEVSPAYYGKLERGINGPSIKRLKMIYEKLGIDITYLITGIANNELTIENMFNECPVEKRYDLGQLMKHAINIAKDTRK